MMIGARTAAWSGGGMPTARDYVQDGLVAMWDGEWNDIGSDGAPFHNPNATVWKDIIGGVTINMTNPVWRNKCLVCGGSTYGVGSNGSIFENQYLTIEYVVSFEETSGYSVAFSVPNEGYSSFAGKRAQQLSLNRGLSRIILSTQYGAQGSNVAFDDGSTMHLLNLSNVCVEYGGYSKVNSFSINGQSFTPNKNEYGTSLANGSRQIIVGCRFSSTSASAAVTNLLIGRIGCIRVYSSISQEGKNANYAIDKARFNLT